MLLTLISYLGMLAIGFSAGAFYIIHRFINKGYITRSDHNNTIEEVVRCLRLQ